MKKIMLVLSLVAIISIMVAAVPVGAVGEEFIGGDWMSTDTLVEFIFAYMRALGYEFVIENIEQWEAVVEEWILEEIYDFLDDIPSISGLAQWILPWSLSWDGWGNMIGNGSFLEDIQDFLEWLNYKYNLENNIVEVKVPSWTFGEYYGFLNDWEFTIANYHDSGTYRDRKYWLGAYQPLYQCYGIFVQIGNDTDFGVLMKSTGSFKFRYRFNNKATNPNTIGPNNGSGGEYDSYLGENYYYYRYDSSVWDYPDYVPFVGLPIYHFETLSEALLAFDINDPSQAPSMTIVSGDIILPDDDPDYEPGDGVTIIEDDNGYIKVYLEVEFPDSINVKNLPAAIVPNAIEAQNISDAFTPIPAMIEDFSDGIELVSSIAMELPTPLWNIAFAIIGAEILAAIIHALKEH